MFVEAKHMPNSILITGVRIEPLQRISTEDCMREGVIRHTFYMVDFKGIRYIYNGMKRGGVLFKTAQEAFAELIDSISGKGTWDSNPWAWVYEFEMYKQQ